MSEQTGRLLEAIASASAFTIVAWLVYGTAGLIAAGTFAFAIAPALAALAHLLLRQENEPDDPADD